MHRRSLGRVCRAQCTLYLRTHIYQYTTDMRVICYAITLPSWRERSSVWFSSEFRAMKLTEVSLSEVIESSSNRLLLLHLQQYLYLLCGQLNHLAYTFLNYVENAHEQRYTSDISGLKSIVTAGEEWAYWILGFDIKEFWVHLEICERNGANSTWIEKLNIKKVFMRLIFYEIILIRKFGLLFVYETH